MTVDLLVVPPEIDFMPATEAEEIIQNVKMILTTFKGSVPMDRAFGLSVDVLDLPIKAAQSRLTAEVVNAVAEFEPRAKVRGVAFNSDEVLDGILGAVVSIELIEGVKI